MSNLLTTTQRGVLHHQIRVAPASARGQGPEDPLLCLSFLFGLLDHGEIWRFLEEGLGLPEHGRWAVVLSSAISQLVQKYFNVLTTGTFALLCTR